MKTLPVILCFLLSNLSFAQKFSNLPIISHKEFAAFLDEMLAIGCINNKSYKKLLSQRDSLPQREELKNTPLSSDRIFAFLAIQQEADAKEKITTLKKWIAAFEKKRLLSPKEIKRMNAFLESQMLPEMSLRTFWLALANWEE